MRAAFSLLALVIVAAIVLSLVKKQATQATALKPPAGAASAASAAALPAPKAVGQQVQSNIDDAAKRNAEAASASAY